MQAGGVLGETLSLAMVCRFSRATQSTGHLSAAAAPPVPPSPTCASWGLCPGTGALRTATTSPSPPLPLP